MDTNNSKKRKNKQQNVSGESQQKFALNSSQSGEFIVPRMSNNTQSESSSVCDTSSQSVTVDQANEANQSTPSLPVNDWQSGVAAWTTGAAGKIRRRWIIHTYTVKL